MYLGRSPNVTPTPSCLRIYTATLIRRLLSREAHQDVNHYYFLELTSRNRLSGHSSNFCGSTSTHDYARPTDSLYSVSNDVMLGLIGPVLCRKTDADSTLLTEPHYSRSTARISVYPQSVFREPMPLRIPCPKLCDMQACSFPTGAETKLPYSSPPNHGGPSLGASHAIFTSGTLSCVYISSRPKILLYTGSVSRFGALNL